MAWRNSTFDLPAGAFVLLFSFRSFLFFFAFLFFFFEPIETLVFGFPER